MRIKLTSSLGKRDGSLGSVSDDEDVGKTSSEFTVEYIAKGFGKRKKENWLELAQIMSKQNFKLTERVRYRNLRGGVPCALLCRRDLGYDHR